MRKRLDNTKIDGKTSDGHSVSLSKPVGLTERQEWAKPQASGKRCAEQFPRRKILLEEPPKSCRDLKNAKYRCRAYCKEHNLEVPQWARRERFSGIERIKVLEEPQKPTDSNRCYARKVAKMLGVPVPEWAQLRKTGRREGNRVNNPLEEPESPNVYNKMRCREYCRKHGIEFPQWARYNHFKKDWRKEPAKITQYAVQMCRTYCAEFGYTLPDWVVETAKRKPKAEEQPTTGHTKKPRVEPRKRDRYNSCLVLCDVGLALWSGLECYWKKAEIECPCLNDSALTTAVMAHSETAYTEAMRVCREVNPSFGTCVRRERKSPINHLSYHATEKRQRGKSDSG